MIATPFLFPELLSPGWYMCFLFVMGCPDSGHLTSLHASMAMFNHIVSKIKFADFSAWYMPQMFDAQLVFSLFILILSLLLCIGVLPEFRWMTTWDSLQSPPLSDLGFRRALPSLYMREDVCSLAGNLGWRHDFSQWELEASHGSHEQGPIPKADLSYTCFI